MPPPPRWSYLTEHTLRFFCSDTHTHFPGLSFISQCVYVCVHVAWQRNLPVSLLSFGCLWVLIIAKSARVTTVSLISFTYGQIVCMRVCVYSVTFDVKTHSTCCSHFWSHPSYHAGHPGADGTRISVCACVQSSNMRKQLTYRSLPLDRLNFSTINLLQPTGAEVVWKLIHTHSHTQLMITGIKLLCECVC